MNNQLYFLYLFLLCYIFYFVNIFYINNFKLTFLII